MRFCVALLVACLAVAQAEVRPRKHIVPVSELKPKYTPAEWQQNLANQVQKPEAYPKFTPGNTRQIDGAGAIRGGSRDPKIVGGADAEAGQFPWQVSMTVDNSWFCGGSIISEDWVLTAAHCANRASYFLLGFGSLAPQSGSAGSVSMESTNYTVHEDYQPARIANDVAVIWLETPIVWSALIGPVRLPRKSQVGETFVDLMATVSGWGLTSDAATEISQTLKWVDILVISNAECSTYFSGVLDNQICTSGAAMTSICSGDSGGPLVFQELDGLFTEIGVVSYGASAGCELGFPQGYSRLTSFLQWIETNTGIIIAD